MSINDLRQDLKDVPGAHDLVMVYGAHGREIYSFGGIIVEVLPMTGREEIATELRKAATAHG